MDTLDALGLELDWNPVAIGIVLGVAYLVWLAITRELSPLASARRRARQNTLRLGRRCALVVAGSWVITLAPPARSVARDVAASLALAACVLLVLFGVRLAGAFLAARADRGERLRRVDAVVRAGAERSARTAPDAPAPTAAPIAASIAAAAPSPPDDPAVDPDASPHRSMPAAPRMAGESAEDRERRETVMDRLEARVRTHDLGSPATSGADPVDAAPDARRRNASAASTVAPTAAPTAAPPAPGADAAPATDPDGSALVAAPAGPLGRRLAEVTAELATLRRVVIAQRAELDFEREAHARSRASARKALDIAQRAVADRRVAIKLARRERRARLELEGRLGADPGARRGNAASMAAPTAAPARADRPRP